MRKSATSKKSKKSLNPMEVWERAWQDHWSKAGVSGYELLAGDNERDFLSDVRTPEKEWPRLVGSAIHFGNTAML